VLYEDGHTIYNCVDILMFLLVFFLVCKNLLCVQPACDANPCREGKCIEICGNSCEFACEI